MSGRLSDQFMVHPGLEPKVCRGGVMCENYQNPGCGTLCPQDLNNSETCANGFSQKSGSTVERNGEGPMVSIVVVGLRCPATDVGFTTALLS